MYTLTHSLLCDTADTFAVSLSRHVCSMTDVSAVWNSSSRGVVGGHFVAPTCFNLKPFLLKCKTKTRKATQGTANSSLDAGSTASVLLASFFYCFYSGAMALTIKSVRGAMQKFLEQASQPRGQVQGNSPQSKRRHKEDEDTKKREEVMSGLSSD